MDGFRICFCGERIGRRLFSMYVVMILSEFGVGRRGNMYGMKKGDGCIHSTSRRR